MFKSYGNLPYNLLFNYNDVFYYDVSNIDTPYLQIDDELTYLDEIKEHYYEYVPNSLCRTDVKLSLPKYVQKLHNIHDNQYQAAMQILRYFESGIHEVVLTAQMQSGKTGVAKYLVHFFRETYQEIMNAKFNDVKIYYICGMNDTDLKTQAIKEFQLLLPYYHILFSKDLQKFCEEYQGYRFTTCTFDMPNLILIDESHFAGQRDSLIDKFLKFMRNEYTYVLSISATACAEIASMTMNKNKAMVYLVPDLHYYGITDLFQRNLIKQAIHLDSHDWQAYEKLADLIAEEYHEQQASSVSHINARLITGVALRRGYGDDLTVARSASSPNEADWKYNIIRLPSKFYYQDLEDKIKELDMHIKFINYHSEFIDLSDFNLLIRDKPDIFTIIWIYGALRASKQLNTQHIGFVHDTAKSRPDIIAQSLMGRIFGYKKEIHDVKCYTDISSAEKMYIWIKHKYLRQYIPKSSTNILYGYDANKVYKPCIWKLHPPIKVELPADLIKYYRSLKFLHKHRYPYKDEFKQDILEIEPSLKTILDNPMYVPGKHGGLMILTEFNKENSYRQHFTQNYMAYLKNRPVRGFCTETTSNNINAYYIFADLNCFSSTMGTVLIIYKNYIKLINKDLTIKANDGSDLDLDLTADYVNVNNKSRFYWGT